AAVKQVEADCARHHGDHCIAYPKAAALFSQPRLYAAGGIEPQRRAAGKRKAVHGLHGALGSERRLLTRARPAAAYVNGCNRRLVEQDRGDAGSEPRIVGVADADTGNIGEKVLQRDGPSTQGDLLVAAISVTSPADVKRRLANPVSGIAREINQSAFE